jgi:hypothetical protein
VPVDLLYGKYELRNLSRDWDIASYENFDILKSIVYLFQRKEDESGTPLYAMSRPEGEYTE